MFLPLSNLLAPRTGSAAGASALRLRRLHPHHLVGDAISFLLILVSWGINPQLRLHFGICICMRWYLAKIVVKAGRCGGKRDVFALFTIFL
jgi:hypothetical protein